MFGKKKNHIKKDLKQSISQIVGIKATGLPQRVVLVNKDFYDDFVKWLTKKGKSPKNLNTEILLSSGKLKPNLRRGIDYEIIISTQWENITKQFGVMHRIDATLIRDPKSNAETLFFSNSDCLQFNIYLPIQRPQTNSYSISSMPIEYYSAPDWLLKDVKRQVCRCYSLDQNSFSLARHSSVNSDEQISENFKMSVVYQSYSKDLDLRHNKLPSQTKATSESKPTLSSMKPHKKSSAYSSSLFDFDSKESRPNNNRNLNVRTETVTTPTKASVSKVTKPKEAPQIVKSNFESVNGRTSISQCPKPVGLHNLGNTCFFNASVQCLARVMPLTNFILSDRFDSQLNPNNPKSTRGTIARSYRRFLENLCSSPSGSALDPSLLRRAIVSKYTRFANYGQHDSQELLCSLLDGLHEDMNQSHEAGGKVRRISIDKESDGWDVHVSRNNSPIVDIFHGILYSSVTCPSCGHVENVRDPFIFLSLPIQRKFATIKLEDCLAKFSREEVLDSNNKWKCEKCKKMVMATKKMGIYKCAKVLIVHLKRFSGDGQFASKIDTPVDYPDVLDIGKYAERDSGRFRLIGAVFHSGGLGGGHYTAAAIDPGSGSWYMFNDSMASKISSDRAHSRGAYILFYQRQE